MLPGFVLDVDYEELVADVETQVRRILDFCDLPWEPQCLAFHLNPRVVRTASSEQVRQPLNATGVHRWRDYERHLGPLIDVLAPLLRRMPASAQPQSPAGRLARGLSAARTRASGRGRPFQSSRPGRVGRTSMFCCRSRDSTRSSARR